MSPHGPGWQWDAAKALDGVAREIAKDWGLTLGPRFGWARHSFAAPAGHDLVLKITPPEDDESEHDADALAFWQGEGAVRLLRHDPVRRAVLLERAIPGHDASGLVDEEAMRVAAEVGRKLWRPLPGGPFRHAGKVMTRWLADLERSSEHP